MTASISQSAHNAPKAPPSPQALIHITFPPSPTGHSAAHTAPPLPTPAHTLCVVWYVAVPTNYPHVHVRLQSANRNPGPPGCEFPKEPRRCLFIYILQSAVAVLQPVCVLLSVIIYIQRETRQAAVASRL